MPTDIITPIPNASVMGWQDQTGLAAPIVGAFYKNLDFVSLADGVALIKRPTFSLETTVATSSATRGRGVYTYQGVDLYATEGLVTSGTTNTVITGGNGLAGQYLAAFRIGYSAGTTSCVFVQNAGDTSTHSSANHGNLYYIATSGGSGTRITNANMPGNNGTSMCRGVVQLDGFTFVCDIFGNIHNSTQNDSTAWAAADFIAAQREPDFGVFIGKHHNHVVYIGTQSIEFFYNAGNASGSPLARRQDVSYRVGCMAPNTVFEDGDVIYFEGVDEQGHVNLYMIDNFQLVPIAPAMAAQFARKIGRITPADISTSTTSGRLTDAAFLTMIRNPKAGRSLVYTPSARVTYGISLDVPGYFSTWDMGGATTYFGLLGSVWGYCCPIVSSARIATAGTLVQFTNGDLGVSQFGDTIHVDGKDLDVSTGFEASWMPPPWSGGSNLKKRFNALRVLHKTSARSDETDADYDFTLSWLDTDKLPSDLDGFKTEQSGDPGADVEGIFPSGRTVSLETQSNNRITRPGSARERVFKMTFNVDNDLAQVQGIEMDFELLGR